MSRWVRLGAAVVGMIMIANLQYSWTLFVRPLIAATHWKLSDVQWGFSFFIAFETWAMPFTGWMIDRIGARIFLTFAGVMCGVGWVSLGHVTTLPALYAFYSLAGFGAALVYCGSMGIALKWFPDKRGLAAGTIAAGFGSGASLFIPIVSHLLKTQDYRTAFLYTGIVQGTLIILAAQFLKNPPEEMKVAIPARVQKRSQKEDFNSGEMLMTPHYYLLFAMATLMGIGGLMATAQVGPMADTLKIGAAALTLSLTINPLCNGAARIIWGWISDHVGRERAMLVAFILQAVFLVSVVTVGKTSTAAFIICLALVYFTWGEVYSIFPSLSADFFGSKNASSNYGFIYSAKGVASIAGGGLAAKLFEKTGSWDYGFYGCAVMALIAAALSLVLKAQPMPVKRAHLTQTAAVEG